MIATCHLVGVNPPDYLADVLPRLARGIVLRDVPAMASAAWKLSRETSRVSSSAAAGKLESAKEAITARARLFMT